MFSTLLLCSMFIAVQQAIDVCTVDDKVCSNRYTFAIGDYRNCLAQLSKNVDVFEVLPIYGWDNLRNVDMGMVIAANYSKCKLTEDGKYLLPDDVFLLPLKQSELQQYAELITHWHNYSSTTSKSINVDAGFGIGGFGISGKYSNEYTRAKSKQVMDSSYTIRTQLRYIGYRAKLQPGAHLHPQFKSALLKIAGYLQMNETAYARYASEILVRDYGTHIVSSTDAGAAIVQEDFVSKSFILQHEANKREILATASAHFFSFAHLGVTYKTSTKNTMSDSFEKSKTSSFTTTHGSSIFVFANYTVTDWASKLDNNLVAIDRSGDPLYYLITTDTLPEVPSSLVSEVLESVKRAIEDYYAYNTHRGCLNDDSPNFSFQANVDDGSCKPPLTNMTFGGVYQTCEMSPGSSAGDLCGVTHQPNPKTGKYSCPTGYSTVRLHSEVFKKSYSTRPCHSCGWWRTCCHVVDHSSTAAVTSYWCAAEHSVPQESGYLFGGMYSSKIANPLTQEKSCPETFYARQVGSDLKVCISDDFEEGVKESLPFAGFYSCDMGNPLAVKKSSSGSDMPKSPLNTLKAYYQKEGASGWPKGCPEGFSSHLGIIDQECAIHYCVVAGALSAKGLPPIRRPPFSSKAPLVQGLTPEYVFQINNGTWVMNTMSDMTPSQQSESGDTSMSPGAASVFAIFVTLACVGLVALVVVVKRKRKTNETRSYAEIGGNASTNSGYGATSDQVIAEGNC